MTDSNDAIHDESLEDIAAKLRMTFHDEAYELLAELESALLELEKRPADSEQINRAFRVLHTIKGSGGLCGFHDIAAFAHEAETYFDLVRKGEVDITKEIIDLTLLARDQLMSMFDVYYKDRKADTERTNEIMAFFKEQTTGKQVNKRGDLAFSELQNTLPPKRHSNEAGRESDSNGDEKVQTGLIEQQPVREVSGRGQSRRAMSSIRVSTDKLDSLTDLVSELVAVEARLGRTALSHDVPGLVSIAEEVERLATALRDNAMSMRMMPIGISFSRFNRLVRDLAAELGKEVELETEGAETELDKKVIERLSDPLIHIIRNSISHGIETPEVRESAGKRRRGSVRLSAAHSGAQVLISIQDDGSGLDKESIRAKAVERGLIKSDADLCDSELFGLIFAPGFSTAEKVTNVSGRGVGLDVVKRAVDALRGSIAILSEPGRGTTITLKLPLTLAIIDGFLTEVCGEHFIFPLVFVEECVELIRPKAAGKHGRSLLHVRGDLVPYVRLREQFAIDGAPPEREQVVIVRVENRRIGFAVDHVAGGHQTVIKNLGTFYRHVEGISGAAILGDGTVALVIDVPKLTQAAEREEAELQN